MSTTEKAAKSAESSAKAGILPFAITFPLLCIAFNGCVKDGCQGALNAQSKALHEAYEYGGWADE